MSGPESTRVDRWVWAVRLAKTRSAATAACRGGHVRVNGKPIKPAALVRVGGPHHSPNFQFSETGRPRAGGR